ncbi:DUF6037 family protein [Pseudomonas kilonensis]|uniref:DUF6037 family protein n=2 Tax=Pseudomonas TaxID=286 RepID=UPI0016966AA6|nr:hypothetical protein [Pseudomonas sp. WS 5410]
MTIHMSGLEKLGKSMQAQNLDIQKFRFKTGAVEFDCLFSMRGDYELSLTTRGANPSFFLFPITKTFQMATYLKGENSKLVNVLRTHGLSMKGFSSTQFFKDLDKIVPSVAHTNNVPTTSEILQLRHDMEERDRPFFDTWIPWTTGGPSAKNKKKTLLLLGPSALIYSEKNNASSRWSSVEPDR